MTKPILSKSQFIKGNQCPLNLWHYRHRKDLISQISDSQQAIFDLGNEIGSLAQTYYKNGVEITENYTEIPKAIESTNDVVKKGTKVIYEATACTKEGFYSRIDILVKVRGKKDEWDLVEVKGSTTPKDYHFLDCAFQRMVFENAGYKIRKSILMHVNNQYVKNGKIDPKKYFTQVDISTVVIELQKEVKKEAKSLLKIIKDKKQPDCNIGSHCNNPFPDFRNLNCVIA